MLKKKHTLVNSSIRNPFLGWVFNRIKRNKNAIIVVNGETGSGKTYSAIELAVRIAKMLGTHFTIQDNMDFNFIELLKKTGLKCNKKAGTVFLFEEVGAVSSGAASRTWQSSANAFFLSFMQTTRHRRQILIFTCPDFAFLDAGARKLVHIQAEMQGIDFEKKLAKLKVYRLQKNSRDGKIYFKFIRFMSGNKVCKMKILNVPKPAPEICKDYEKLKGEYTTRLNEMIMKSQEPKDEYKAKTKVPLDDFKHAWKVEKLTDAGLCRKFNIGFTTCQGYKRTLKGEDELDNPSAPDFKMPSRPFNQDQYVPPSE